MLEDRDIEDLKSYGLLNSERLLRQKDPEFKLRLYRDITMGNRGGAGRVSEPAANAAGSGDRFGWKRPVGWAVAIVALAAAGIGLTRLSLFSGEVIEASDSVPSTSAFDSPQNSELSLYEIVPAIEDPEFYSHSGHAEGYYSITQQLAVVMNAEIFSGDFGEVVVDEDLLRLKVDELEREFSKNEILDEYLDTVYLGNGFYGVSAAAEGYWGRPLGELSVCNLADLAGLIENATLHTLNRPAFGSRREQVLKILGSQGLFTEDQIAQCGEESVPLP